MADATTTTLTQASDPTDEKPRFMGLSLTQITGSALAAVTTAVAASFFGVAGTLIGAAFGSVVSTVAGAAYATSLERAARLRPRTLLVRPGPDRVAGAAQDDPARLPSGLGSEQVPVAEVLPAAAAPTGPAGPGGPADGPWWSRLTWRPIAAVAALGFVVAVGVLTLTESALGHPVSDSASGGTTIGQVVGTAPEATPAPQESATPDPSGSATAPSPDPTATDADPSAPVSPSDPAADPTPGPTAPTADPSPPAADPSDPAGTPADGGATPAPTGAVTP